MTHQPHLSSAFSSDSPRDWDRQAVTHARSPSAETAQPATAVDLASAPAEGPTSDEMDSNVVVLPMSVEIERERVPRRSSVKSAVAELQVGDVVVASPVGAGTITSFTDRGVPRVKHVAVTWLERQDGTVYDPQQRRR